MLRFLLEKFREAPGPLKQPRLIVADLAEEVLDLAEHYLHKDGQDDFHETKTLAAASARRTAPRSAVKHHS